MEFPTAVKVTPPELVEKVTSGATSKLLVVAVRVIVEPEGTVDDGLAVTETEGALKTLTTWEQEALTPEASLIVAEAVL